MLNLVRNKVILLTLPVLTILDLFVHSTFSAATRPLTLAKLWGGFAVDIDHSHEGICSSSGSETQSWDSE